MVSTVVPRGWSVAARWPNDRHNNIETSIHVKHPWYAFTTVCLFLIVQGSAAQDRGFGLGIILGEPTGFSAKLWTSPTTAFDFGLGLSVGGDGFRRSSGTFGGQSRIHFHMDYLWHSFEAFKSDVRLPVYYGVGGRFNTGAGYNNSAAIRGVFGILWLPRQAPVDLFLELAPTLQFTSPAGFGMDAGIGARYYF
jgi:hypothetical protein